MKIATIIITILGILISAVTIHYINEIETNTEVISSMNSRNSYMDNEFDEIANNVDDSEDRNKYHYNSLDLETNQYIAVNACMQVFQKDNSFNNANNCQEEIVDAIIENIGETTLIKSIVGDMLSYTKKGVYLNTNYLKNLIIFNQRESHLKSNIVLAFINRHRDPVKLQAVYNENKNYFFSFITKNVYQKVFQDEINEFITSYEEINNQTDKEKFYRDIYFKAEKQNNQSDYWVYTFWKRRELEKNSKILYNALTEIDAYYKAQ